MPYVACEECGGYYELKEGESIFDFEKCRCGGKLKYAGTLEEILNKKSDSTREKVQTKTTVKKREYNDKFSRKNLKPIICPECGVGNSYDSVFCRKCGYNFKSSRVEPEKKSRTIELVLGIVGGIFGLLGGIFAVIFGIFASEITGLGISAILASIVGIVGSAYLLKDPKWGGIILVISAVWLLISISLFGVLGAVLLGLAGLLALLR